MKSSSKKNVSGFSISESVRPVELASLIKHIKSASQGKLLHNYLLQHGQIHVTFLRNCLIEMYGNCGCVADARSVFDNIQNPNLYSYNLMIRSYALDGNTNDAQNLFYQTPNPDIYTWNLLLKAFIKYGALQGALKTFECMPYHSIVSWTAMIAALAQDGRGQEALELFYRLHTQCLQLKVDQVTFLRVLNACSNYSLLAQGQEIHAAIVENGYGGDDVVATSLISMYGKCESLAHAKAVFLRTKKKDIVCWTALITACAQNEHHEEALYLSLEMQNGGIAPDNYTYVCILNACSGLLLLEEGRQIHSIVVEEGLAQHFMMGTALVNFYGKCKSLQDARTVFGCLTHRDVVSWNAMISALVESDCNQGALHLFWQMHLHAIKADNVTYLCGLIACINLAALEEGQEIHMALVEYEIVGDVMLTNSLINLYGKCRSLHDANFLFYGLAHCALVSWNILISAYVNSGLAKESLALLQDMQQAGIKADNVTFAFSVEACSLLADLKKGQETHANLVKSGFGEDPMVCSALLRMYGKCKSTHDVVCIFENVKEVDIVLWTALIGAHVENGCSEAALSAFWQMQLKGLQPDDMAYVCALDACASLAALDQGGEIHDAVQEKGREKEPMVANALIHMYGNCGAMKMTRSIFESLSEPNLATWNAVIAAFAHNGQGEEALGFFDKMVDKGRLEEAEHILQHLSVENADMAWLSFLGACRIHNDHARALHAAEKLS
ncbi:hypothetical protein L7F22_024144 [Adiantum nelumboides]|nr:hypothetical protein [Adiantum nelumboides]